MSRRPKLSLLQHTSPHIAGACLYVPVLDFQFKTVAPPISAPPDCDFALDVERRILTQLPSVAAAHQRPVKVDTIHVRPLPIFTLPKRRVAQQRPIEIRPSQIASVEPRLVRVRARKVDPSKVRVPRARPRHFRLRQVRLLKVRPVRVDPGQNLPAKVFPRVIAPSQRQHRFRERPGGHLERKLGSNIRERIQRLDRASLFG